MRIVSRQGIKESRANLPVLVPQADRGGPNASTGHAEKEENTDSPDDGKVSKICGISDEQCGEGTRGLLVRGLPLIFLPHQIEALWEVVAAADAAAAAEEAAATADFARAEAASAEVSGTASSVQMARPYSSTQTQTLRKQDSPGSRPPLLNTSSESPTALPGRPPSPSEQHGSLQRKHVVAPSGQRKHPVGPGKEVHTAAKQGKSINSGATGSASRTAAVAGSSNASSVVAAAGGVLGPAAGTGSAGGKVSSRSGVSGGATAGSSHLSPKICLDVEREVNSTPKSERSTLLRKLICQHLTTASGQSGEESSTYACAAVVELHIFSLLFAGTIGLCSEKAALYMSIIAAAVEDLQQEKTASSMLHSHA